jgi:CRISPR-associated protein Cas4
MYNFIPISKINDFLFCPYSLYYHSIYEGYNQKVCHALPQTTGKIKHALIDCGKYSTEKRYLQGMAVCSEKYGLAGKIDIYDAETKTLIERKNKVGRVYEGYKFQLFAQYFCLMEIGYEVKKLKIRSLSDNKNYVIDLPTGAELENFEKVIREIRDFDVAANNYRKNPVKCAKCIYRELCNY